MHVWWVPREEAGARWTPTYSRVSSGADGSKFRQRDGGQMDAAGTRTREFRRPQTGQTVSSKQAPGGRHAAMRAGRGDSGLLVSSLSSHAVTEACFLRLVSYLSCHAGATAAGMPASGLWALKQ